MVRDRGNDGDEAHIAGKCECDWPSNPKLLISIFTADFSCMPEISRFFGIRVEMFMTTIFLRTFMHVTKANVQHSLWTAD